MEEESTTRGGTEGGSKPLSKAPAFFVILHPSHGDGSKEEGILVANRDVSSVAPVITTGPNNSKSDFFLSANCISGEITVTLDNNNMWNEFYRCNTEMVLTKQGRRMFPYCRYWISGLDPYLKYILVMDITPLDNYRHKWNGKWWEPGGKADPHVLGRVFIHPESPSTGQYWMHQPVSFYKLKLTNNILDQDGHIILHSMHRYLPRLHVVPAEKASEIIQLNGPDVHTFTFPQTEFIAVTAYQNFQITQLKIDCNPFAKGFREGMVTGRPGKDVKLKPEPEVDSSNSKNIEENEDPNNMEKLQELFRMSEYLDCDKENERFSSVQDFLRFTKSKSELAKNSKQNEDVIKRYDEPSSSVTSPTIPTEQPSVVVKQEPEDNYDYSQAAAMGSVSVKQEPSDGEVTDDYSNSDADYPILERQFAKFKEDPYLDGNHSLNSPTGLLEERFLKPDPDSMPVLHPEPCALRQKILKAPDQLKSDLSEEAPQDTAVPKKIPVFPSISIKSEVEDDIPVKEKRKRICKKKIDEIYATLQTALKTTRGPKRKLPLLSTKPSLAPTPGNEGTVAPIAKKRGRPPKPKISKVGRPAKKDNPIEAPRLFPDFKPDLEDVDGVLFVAFSSKEALDVHTVKKPMDTVSSSLPSLEASTELTDDMKKILELERQLLTHLKTMKYRQVIHPALQQVGLKLNIVDPTMSIDLRYLGVELPLPYITSDTKYEDNGLCAQGLPFVSRTGKTTDFTKIKGWRDKFSTESATSSQKNEAGRPESSVKNLSAFCSDELDEYLENEAKLMGDLKELTPEPVSSISYQLPTKSSSYVRTLDSVLKKQAQQAMSSLNAAAEQLPTPRVKRKYTRRAPTLKSNPKLKPILPVPPNAKKPCKSQSQCKKHRSASYLQNMVKAPPSTSVELLSKSKPTVKPEREQMDTIQQNLYQAQMQSQQFFSKPIGFAKSQLKLSDLEESAILNGKPRTYVTEERASVALCTLLTAQASLKKKPILTFSKKPSTSCKMEFCRLGCICSSLSLRKLVTTHCRHEACMFSCECLRTKSYAGTDGLTAKESGTFQEKAEIDLSPIPGHGYQAERGAESLEVMQREERQELSIDALQNRPMKSKKRKSTEGTDKKSDIRASIRFPIWNRSDVADDPEPLCVPEQGEIIEARILHQGHFEKNKSPEGGKPGRLSTVSKLHSEDPVFLYFDNMMTCARVRGYQRKAPEEKKAKDRRICALDAPNKGNGHKIIRTIKQEKEDYGVYEIAEEKKSTAVGDDGPTKLIEMISDCHREEEESKVLNTTLQHMAAKEPPSFTVGSSDIELVQGPKRDQKAQDQTAMSAEKQSSPDPPKLSPAEHNVESVKPADEEPEYASADKEEKSPGRKGLPFYSKVIPAGKLMARLKTSDDNKAELVEVNGKKYPHAKLLLGHMGAIHPANRLAAYLTHRLSPRHFHISKVNNASAKMATESPSSDSTTEEKAKNILTSEQNKTAAQSRPSSIFTQFVMGEVGSVQNSLGVSSSEPTILGSPKLSTQSTRLLVISSAVPAAKQAPAITTTSSSMNLPSLSTTSLSSDGLNTESPSKKKMATSLPTLMRVTKLVTKSSSVLIPAGIVAENDTPPTKSNILTPPLLTAALAKSLETTGNTSALPPSQNPGIIKIAPSSLLLASTPPGPGSKATQGGLNIASPVTVKPVATSLLPSGASSGLQKRVGPRLLLIPVNSTSAAAQPVQSVPSPPGQKMVLQPIKSPNGVTLFKHPNGQIIQLVPLQKVNSANIQQSRQQVVLRNPAPVMSVRLPFLPKPEAATTASISATSVSTASTPTNVPVVSPSKTSPNKSGGTLLPQNLPVLSQFGTIAVNTSLPTSNSEAPLSFPQVLTYMGSGHTVIASNVAPLQSLANIPPPPPLLQNCSNVSAAAKPTITLTSNESGSGCDPNEHDKKLSKSSVSPQPSGEKGDQESVKECEGQPTSEVLNDENEAETQRSPKEEIKSVTPAEDKPCHSGQQVIDPSTDSIDEFLTSDEDLFQEPKKRDIQDPLDEDNNQSPAEKNLSSQVEIVPNVPKEVEQNMQYKSGEKAELSVEQGSAKVSTSSSDQKNGSPLQRGPHSKQEIFGTRATRPNLQIEEDSDIERSVDIETVEELSEKMIFAHLKSSAFPDTFKKNKHGMKRKFSKKHKIKSKGEVDEYLDFESVEEIAAKINLADLKASSSTITSDNYGSKGNLSKGLTKVYKVDGEDVFSSVEEEGGNVYHRKNHTANERKRRSELRDLFGELRDAIGVYNLPKISKSYILKQAIEEIKDLTNTADTLIKTKTLLSQTQILLVKKVSNLSGKSKEVILKKVEYKCAKDKAIQAEMKKKNLEQDDALHKASINLSLPKMKPFIPFIPLKLKEESSETLITKTKKPIILGRKSLLLSTEGKQTPGVSLPTSQILMAPTGQGEHNIVSGEFAGVPTTLIKAGLSSVQMKSGLSSVVIQLPSKIQLKDIVGHSPVPVPLSALPGDLSALSPTFSVSEVDDLSMMPRIVNVTSLAHQAKSDFCMELDIATPDSERLWKSDEHFLGSDSGNPSVRDASFVTAESCMPSTSIHTDKVKDNITDTTGESCHLYSSLLENPHQEDDSSNTRASLQCKIVSSSNDSLSNEIRDPVLDLDLKKLTSAIDEAGLDLGELSDTMGDPEEADETLTSLLNEIAFLNQQISNDTDDLDSVPDFPGTDTASRSSASKFAGGDSSPLFLSGCKEGPEAKDKTIPFSPFVMQLEEGEIPDSTKHNQESGIMACEAGARREPPIGTQSEPSAFVSTHETTEKPVTSEVFWRPMPKLTPFGLKSHTIPSDPRVLTSKSMPSLASVAMRLSSPKTTD